MFDRTHEHVHRAANVPGVQDSGVLSPLERRVRRIATIIMVLAIAAAGIGMLDGEINWAQHTVVMAGGPSLASWVAIVCIGAAMVIRRPQRQAARMWIAVSIGTFVSAILWWSVNHLDLLDRHTILWPEHTMFALVGAVLVLLCVGLPIVLLTSSEHRDGLPKMRVVD